MKGDESSTSFTNSFFHFSGPPGFRRAFHAVERNGKFGRIQCQRSKEKEMSISSATEERERDEYFFAEGQWESKNEPKSSQQAF